MPYEPYRLSPEHRAAQEAGPYGALRLVENVEYRDYHGGGHPRAAVMRATVLVDLREGPARLTVTVDQLHGLVDVGTRRTTSRSEGWTYAPLKHLIWPDWRQLWLLLHRLVELCDETPETTPRFEMTFPAKFILRALRDPEGIGFPAFTASVMPGLQARLRATAPVEEGDVPPGRGDAWYAHVRTFTGDPGPFAPYAETWIPEIELQRTQVWTIARCGRDADAFRWSSDYEVGGTQDGIEIVVENDGFGRARPRRRSLYGNTRLWADPDDRLFALTDEELAKIALHVVEPFER